MGPPKVTDAGDAGHVAGLLVGLLQGAAVGSLAIPVPVVGSFVGAVVGGMVGGKAGDYVGETMTKGATVAVKSATIIAACTAATFRRPKPAARTAPTRPTEVMATPLVVVDTGNGRGAAVGNGRTEKVASEAPPDID